VIVVVCLNPALDVTHHVPKVDWGGVNRPTAVYARPGGKGTNVARALHSFGRPIVLLGFAGGTTGGAVTAALRELGVPAQFTPAAGETRRTFSVVDGDGRAARFNEPGPEVGAPEFARFLLAYGKAVAGASAVVLSGSLPRGLPPAAYAELIALAARAGVPAVLDTSGDALRAGVAAGPAVVKPNLDELQVLTGRSLRAADGGPDLAAVAAAAAGLRAAGAQAVVASLGPEGLLAVTGDGSWHARPAAVRGNATGAGDAVTAALAHRLALGRPWEDRLRHAAALGAASVAAPVAGEYRQADYAAALPAVTVRPLPAPQVPARHKEAC
jgi:tagatose 6-phosphate kinase